MSLNLNELLADLEQSAGIEKTASMQTEVKPAVSAELASVLTKKAEQDLSASAFDEGAKLAQQLLEKLATDIQVENGIMQAQDDKKIVPTSGGTVSEQLEATVHQAVARGGESDDLLNKQAQLNTENKNMAKSIMQKLAQIVGEPTTTPAAAANITPGTVPNVVQMANAEMTAYDDAKVQPMPGTEGTINNILEAIVERAKSQGDGSSNLVDGEGPVEGHASLGTGGDQQEKAAAVSALVGEGMDFDQAVDLVKQAEVQLIEEASGQEKIAAVNALTEAGYDFDTAIELVKQAEAEIAAEEVEMEKVAGLEELIASGTSFDDAVELIKKADKENKEAWKATGRAQVRSMGEGLAGGVGGGVAGAGIGAGVAKLLKKDPKLAALGAGYAGYMGGALGGGLHGMKASIKNTIKKHTAEAEKKAAFDELVANGVNFDDAIELIKKAELEVYGE